MDERPDRGLPGFVVERVRDAIKDVVEVIDDAIVDVSDPPEVPATADPKLREQFHKMRYQAELDEWRAIQQAQRAAPISKPDPPAPPLNHDGSRVPAPTKDVRAVGAEELVKSYYTGIVDEWRTTWRDGVQDKIDARKLNEQREDADIKAETELVKAVHDAYLEVAKASLDRAIQRATFVTTVVTGISALYTGALALVFSLASTPAQPLPPRGVVPLVFLGLGLVFSAFYMAFIRSSQRRRILLPSGIGGEVEQQRLATFMEWTFSGVLARAWALRAAVVCLGLGVVFLPIAFLSVSATWIAVGIGLGAGLLAAWLIGELVWWLISRKRPYVADQVNDPPALA